MPAARSWCDCASAAVAGHQDDRQLRPNPMQGDGEFGAGHAGHDLVGQKQVEPVGIGTKGCQRRGAAIEADGLVAEGRQHLLAEQYERRFVIDQKDGLAAAGWAGAPAPELGPAALRREVDLEGAACARPALHVDGAAVVRHDAVNGRQAEPVPLPAALVVKKGSKTRSTVASSMPRPASLTVRRA